MRRPKVPFRWPSTLLNRWRLLLIEGLVRLNLSQDIQFLLIAVVVGLAAGYGAGRPIILIGVAAEH